MNQIIRMSIAMAALWLLVGCSSSTPKPQSVTMPGADFSAYKTFGWKRNEGNGAATAPLTILDTNIENAIQAQLLAKGYVESNDNPDFRVSYEPRTYFVEKKSNPFSIGLGVGSFGNNVGSSVGASVPVGGGTSEDELQELIIRALEPESDKELWMGSSTRKTKDALDPASIKKAVDTSMEGFPARQ